jgi:hypothetical protein
MNFYQLMNVATAESIAENIYQEFSRNMPRDTGEMIDYSLLSNKVYRLSDKLAYFDIGNVGAETKTPHYHILQDAKWIHKAGKANAKSRGSQYGLSPMQRDYATKEYQKRYRDTMTSKNYYYNKHYHYIDRILDEEIPKLASMLGGKWQLGAGLGEEETKQLFSSINAQRLLNK